MSPRGDSPRNQADSPQFRITNATRGKVDFELDIQKQHTVSFPPSPPPYLPISAPLPLSYTHVPVPRSPNTQNRLRTLHGGTIASMVDLGGSLAVASMGRFSTGVSTDINGPCFLPPGPGHSWLPLTD